MSRLHVLLASFAAAAATIVAVVMSMSPIPAPEDPFEGLHLSAAEEAELAVDEVLDSPTVRYTSKRFSYAVSYPGTWTLDDTKEVYGGDVITDPDERVVITINETEDPELLTPEGMQRTADSIEDSLSFDPEFTLIHFERLIYDNFPAVFTDGIRYIGGKRYHTREYSVFRPVHGGILNISISTPEDAEQLYEKAIGDILRSLDVCVFAK